MKKTLLTLASVLLLTFTACSSENYSHDAQTLPEKAQSMISQYFKSAISVVKEEKEAFSGKEYEVVLSNGCEITFDGNGEWKNIETPVNLSVPEALILPSISNYVVNHHKGATIVGIEKNKKGYEVELSNGVEIQFNQEGGFLQYDK